MMTEEIETAHLKGKFMSPERIIEIMQEWEIDYQQRESGRHEKGISPCVRFFIVLRAV